MVSSTTTVKLWLALRLGVPSSVTTTLMTFVLGPWASEGVQLKMPLVGFMKAPAGTLVPRLKVNVCAGTSKSAAELVNTRAVVSTIVKLVIGLRIGG